MKLKYQAKENICNKIKMEQNRKNQRSLNASPLLIKESNEYT